jgi:hypothetical protein
MARRQEIAPPASTGSSEQPWILTCRVYNKFMGASPVYARLEAGAGATSFTSAASQSQSSVSFSSVARPFTVLLVGTKPPSREEKRDGHSVTQGTRDSEQVGHAVNKTW